MEQPLGVSFEKAFDYFREGAAILFAADPRVQAVGIGLFPGGFGYRVTRNEKIIVPLGVIKQVTQVHHIPISYINTANSVQPLTRVPLGGGSGIPVSPGLEQGQHRPIVCGLQIQNLDCDIRKGLLSRGRISIGSLGCFVERYGDICLLSNNHVLAGENNGKHNDRIMQPKVDNIPPLNGIAELRHFVPLQYSSYGATVSAGTIVWNEVDAAVAAINRGISHRQEYLSHHNLPTINGVGTAQLGEEVFKVGCATGLRYGIVTSVGTIVGPVPYPGGPCWFRRSFEIEGLNGITFSDEGDSGSVIVNMRGEVVGLLYSGNGVQTYACPMDFVLNSLSCRLI